MGKFKNTNLIDFQSYGDLAIDEFKKINKQFFQGKRIRYGIPLVINENVLGMMTINEKVTKNEFTIEDFDLLKTISDQVAAALLNLKLSEQLRDLKELEALRTISAFIMHDLKNVASTLSLTMQNLPIYYENPEFRQDAVHVTEQSLNKINSLCIGLSALSHKIEIKKINSDINKLILETFSSLNIFPSSQLNISSFDFDNTSPHMREEQDKGERQAPLQVFEWKLNGSKILVFYNPQVQINSLFDPEQIHKVIVNLLLNAKDALRDGGRIEISTKQNKNWIEISVSDNGCGMSKEFIEKSLFRPFKTTKKKGMGIGLFQSKMIIEAHGGVMEVESKENVGTTFKILLPYNEH
ncbi:MAG: ATP-binding protein [Thermodesulfobacteriota bacterium]